MKSPKISSKINSKKAQDASSAATLVAVLALLIVFYLLFIPPDYRDQILQGNDSSTSSTGTTGDGIEESILKASPGTLSPISAEEVEHNIPSITLYAKTSSKVLQNQNQLYVKSSIFGQKKATMTFNVDDTENTINGLLSFLRTSGKGNLIVRLNGNEIFSGDIKKENPEPIKLPANLMNNGQNTLEFEAEKVGMAFWRRNRQQMENLQITADVKDLTRQQSRNMFIVSATEKSNVKRSVLRFTPDCTIGKVGKLNVNINQYSAYYAVPDCGGRVAIEFAPEWLREGENTINFESEKGSYLIDLIRITNELKEVIQPAYYFEFTEDDMKALRDGDFDVVLRLTFIDSAEMKSGRINVNGRELNLYQTEREFEKNINDYLVEGNNAIKVTPDTPLEIVNLEVLKD